MEHVGPMHHKPYVSGRRVDTLAVLDGPLKHVGEFRFGAQIIGTHEIDHAPILQKVVLQRVAGEHDPSFRPYGLQHLRNGGVSIFDSVAFIAYDQIWARIYQKLSNICKENVIFLLSAK